MRANIPEYTLYSLGAREVFASPAETAFFYLSVVGMVNYWAVAVCAGEADGRRRSGLVRDSSRCEEGGRAPSVTPAMTTHSGQRVQPCYCSSSCILVPV